MKITLYFNKNTYAEKKRQQIVPLLFLKLLTILLLLLPFSHAEAQVTCPLNDNFDLSGNATITSGYIRLTPNTLNYTGRAWSKDKNVSLSADFNATFKIYAGAANAGGRGMAFILKGNPNQVSPTDIYTGITPSLAFEFDTYYLSSHTGDPSTGEDHFALHRDGDPLLAGRIGNPVILGTGGNIEDGQWHDVIVDWKAATKTITVTFDGSVIYTVVRDIVALDFANNPIVSFGFTADGLSSGTSNEHRVCVSSMNYPVCATVAPVLSSTSVTATCPTNTTNLNSLVTSTMPSGASLVWFTNNTHTGTAYSTPTTATAGTYYGFYYTAARDCYSPATAAVTVIKGCCKNSEFNLSGNAIISGEYIRLTPPNLANQKGQAWSKNATDLTQNFTIETKMYFGNNTGSGGGGIAFVLRGNSTQTGGTREITLGYSGITPSLAFEFDTYPNVSANGVDAGDPSLDHFALHRNGDYLATGRISNNIVIGNSGEIENGLWHTATIDWKAATKTITVSFDGAVIYTVVRDIVALDLAGNPSVTFGFSATTGAGTITSEHRVCVQDITAASCQAGTTAPALSGTTTTTVCPTKTANINGLVTSIVPSGASLVWFTNNAHTGTAYSTPTSAVAGTYYAFYYDDAGIGCYSPASTAVTVNLQTTLCADLSLTASPNTSTKNKGEIIVYTYTLNNAGPDAAPNAKVRIGIPNNTTLLTAQPSQGTFVESSSVWEAGNVVSSAAPTLTVTVKVN